MPAKKDTLLLRCTKCGLQRDFRKEEFLLCPVCGSVEFMAIDRNKKWNLPMPADPFANRPARRGGLLPQEEQAIAEWPPPQVHVGFNDPQ